MEMRSQIQEAFISALLRIFWLWVELEKTNLKTAICGGLEILPEQLKTLGRLHLRDGLLIFVDP